MNYGYCYMPNGEKLQFERWAYERWQHGAGCLTDPVLLRMFNTAVHISICW